MDSRKLLAQATSAVETTWEDSIVNFGNEVQLFLQSLHYKFQKRNKLQF